MREVTGFPWSIGVILAILVLVVCIVAFFVPGMIGFHLLLALVAALAVARLL